MMGINKYLAVISNRVIMMEFKNKRILVTGGTGSIGSALVEELIKESPKQIRVFSRGESKQFDLENRLGTHNFMINYLLGDIRDKDRLFFAMENIDIVFHAAALKHVKYCENNPFEAMKTNNIGTQNAIETALYRGVSNFITISTDKAVNPCNVMGSTKLLAERLTINAERYKGDKPTKFSCVRFGNVLYSYGSVLQIFKEQIKEKKPLTITNKKMTRFIMTIKQAVSLVLKASTMAVGGEIFILKMPAVNIVDLAKAYSEVIEPKYRFEYKEIGKKDGEKIHEELMTEDEISIARELEDMFVIPYTEEARKHYSKYPKVSLKRYSSEDNLIKFEEVKKIISRCKGESHI